VVQRVEVVRVGRTRDVVAGASRELGDQLRKLGLVIDDEQTGPGTCSHGYGIVCWALRTPRGATTDRRMVDELCHGGLHQAFRT
jgi:hypothetical protein